MYSRPSEPPGGGGRWGGRVGDGLAGLRDGDGVSLGATVGSPHSCASCASRSAWWLLTIAALPQISYPANRSRTNPRVIMISPTVRIAVRTGDPSVNGTRSLWRPR
jgi:hypothetical protein